MVTNLFNIPTRGSSIPKVPTKFPAQSSDPDLIRIADQLNLNAQSSALTPDDIRRIKEQLRLFDVSDQEIIDRFSPRTFDTKVAERVIDDVLFQLGKKGIVTNEAEMRVAFAIVKSNLFNPLAAQPDAFTPQGTDTLTASVLRAITDTQQIIQIFPNQPTRGLRLGAMLRGMRDTGLLTHTEYRQLVGDEFPSNQEQVASYLKFVTDSLPEWEKAVVVATAPGQRGDFHLRSIDLAQRKEVEPRQRGVLPEDNPDQFILRTPAEFTGRAVEALRSAAQEQGFMAQLVENPGEALNVILRAAGLPTSVQRAYPHRLTNSPTPR